MFGELGNLSNFKVMKLFKENIFKKPVAPKYEPFGVLKKTANVHIDPATRLRVK